MNSRLKYLAIFLLGIIVDLCVVVYGKDAHFGATLPIHAQHLQQVKKIALKSATVKKNPVIKKIAPKSVIVKKTPVIKKITTPLVKNNGVKKLSPHATKKLVKNLVLPKIKQGKILHAKHKKYKHAKRYPRRRKKLAAGHKSLISKQRRKKTQEMIALLTSGKYKGHSHFKNKKHKLITAHNHVKALPKNTIAPRHVQKNTSIKKKK